MKEGKTNEPDQSITCLVLVHRALFFKFNFMPFLYVTKINNKQA